jgi:hypothetical protein
VSDDHARGLAGRLRRHLGRWAGIYLAAVVLLALSEVVWVWQSWPVRHLLEMGP